MFGQKLPGNPIDLAAATAERLAWREALEAEHLERRIAELDDSAEIMGFIGRKYLVHSHRSLMLPIEYEEQASTKYEDYYDCMFEGEFKTFSHVQIGTIVGAHAVRALCAMFDNVTVVPEFRGMPADYLLHVPVLAVETINPQAA